MYSNQIAVKEELDQEWLYLITEAKKAGLTITEIRDFLKQENLPNGLIHYLHKSTNIG